MDPSTLPLFDLADRRLEWAANRQAVLSENIANTDTPGWHARDVAPFDPASGGGGFALALTQAGHIAGSSPSAAAATSSSGERAPDGNSVSLDGELVKIAETDMADNVATDVYKAYIGMFRTAIGR